MASILRFDAQPPGEGRRWLAGVLVSSLGDRADAALVGVLGCGLDARPELAAASSIEIPRETAALLCPLLEGAAAPAASLAAVQAQLAEIEAALLGDLLAQGPPPPAGVLAAGIHDPGFWAFKRSPTADHARLTRRVPLLARPAVLLTRLGKPIVAPIIAIRSVHQSPPNTPATASPPDILAAAMRPGWPS